MPVQHSVLEFHRVERILKTRGFGFTQHQGGFFQLNRPSTTAFRGDGTPHRDPLPGLISPQMQERVLTYARNEEDAATHFIALATQKVTDPILEGEPTQAPPVDMEALERVAGTIAENKLADIVATIRAENAKQLEGILTENAKLRARLDELEAPDEDEPEEPSAPKSAGKKKGKKKGGWRNKPVPDPKQAATGQPPAPPMDMGIA